MHLVLYSNLWYVHTYQHSADSPPETCVSMAVRMAASKTPDHYDVSWVNSFNQDDSVNLRLLADISRETGLKLDNFNMDENDTVIVNIDAETLKAFYVFNISWAESKHKMAESVREVINARNMHLDNSNPSLHLV